MTEELKRQSKCDKEDARPSRKKPRLPHGWAVRQSRTYPDRMYYYNTYTGHSSWKLPIEEDGNWKNATSRKVPQKTKEVLSSKAILSRCQAKTYEQDSNTQQDLIKRTSNKIKCHRYQPKCIAASNLELQDMSCSVLGPTASQEKSSGSNTECSLLRKYSDGDTCEKSSKINRHVESKSQKSGSNSTVSFTISYDSPRIFFSSKHSTKSHEKYQSIKDFSNTFSETIGKKSSSKEKLTYTKAVMCEKQRTKEDSDCFLSVIKKKHIKQQSSPYKTVSKHKLSEGSPENSLPEKKSLKSVTRDIVNSTVISHSSYKSDLSCRSSRVLTGSVEESSILMQSHPLSEHFTQQETANYKEHNSFDTSLKRQASPGHDEFRNSSLMSADEHLQKRRRHVMPCQLSTDEGAPWQHNLPTAAVDVPTTAPENIPEEAAMDWEYTEEKTIQEVREQICSGDLAVEGKLTALQASQAVDLPPAGSAVPPTADLFLVLDTNILLSNLKYVEEIRDTAIEGFGLPVLLIPWLVLQELDALKDQKHVKLGHHKTSLEKKARKAVTFLHSAFISYHPRVKGETTVESAAAATKFGAAVADDSILQYCLLLAEAGRSVILLSNDKNLCCKALVHSVQAYSQESFLQHVQSLSTKKETIVSGTENGPRRGHHRREHTSTQASPPQQSSAGLVKQEEIRRADDLLCQLKSVLKDTLSKVLKTEMELAYGELWKEIVMVQPPWTLNDVFKCILKHWIAVFGLVLKKTSKTQIEDLKERFSNKHGYGISLNGTSSVLQKGLEMLLTLQQKSTYNGAISDAIKTIEKLVRKHEEDSTALQEMAEGTFRRECLGEQQQPASDSMRPGLSEKDMKTEVLKLFQLVWDHINNLVGLLGDSLAVSHQLQYSHPEIIPSREEGLQFLPKLYSCVHQLDRDLATVLRISVEQLGSSAADLQQLYSCLVNFLPSLGIQKVDSCITIEMLHLLFKDVETRELIQNGAAHLHRYTVMLEQFQSAVEQQCPEPL